MSVTSNKKITRGFTLIELLISITILAVLTAITLVSYTSFMQKSRDAKRQSEFKVIQSALEVYHTDQLYYPTLETSDCPQKGDGKLRFGCDLTNPSGSKNYTLSMPNDPKFPDARYLYQPKPENCNNTNKLCTEYCLLAVMENLTDPKTEGSCVLSDSFNFAVTRP